MLSVAFTPLRYVSAELSEPASGVVPDARSSKSRPAGTAVAAGKFDWLSTHSRRSYALSGENEVRTSPASKVPQEPGMLS